MKSFSGRHYFLAGVAAMMLAGCAAPDAQVGTDGAKLAAVKCNRVSDVPLGTLARKDCTTPNTGNQVDKQEFMNALQVPGSVPQH